jgi:hypothetical protein
VTQIIVHIGPHKTGTTYLQITLHALRYTLLERGVYVPSCWEAAPGLPSHMQLVWAVRKRDLTLIRHQIQEILARRPRYLVISCEALSRLDQGQIAQLRRLFGPAPAQVVYYVRRWPERLPSLWQETVKFGHTATFPEFLAEQLTRHGDSELRDISTIDKFATVFGASHVKVVSYNQLVESDIDIAGHFLRSFIGLSDINLPAAERPNRSLPILDTELIRALNTIHAQDGGERSPGLRNWFLTHRNCLVPDSILDAMRESSGSIRLDESVPSLLLAPQEMLTRYRSSIVPPHHADGLHELRAIDVPYVRPDYLLQPTATNALRTIYQKYRRSL